MGFLAGQGVLREAREAHALNFRNAARRLGLLVGMAMQVMAFQAAAAATYPLAKDASWTYQVTSTGSGRKTVRTFAVVNVEKVGRYKYYDIARGKSKKAGKIFFSEDNGKYYLDGYKRRMLITGSNVWFEPSLALLNSPLTPGLKKHIDLTARGFLFRRSLRIDAEVARKEEVVTPAGRFDALCVHVGMKGRRNEQCCDVWFVPGVGVVKYKGERREAVLIAYVIPKAAAPQAHVPTPRQKKREAPVQFTGFTSR